MKVKELMEKMNNSYHKWLEFTNIYNQYCLCMSEKQFFGKNIKKRLKKKWHHRYLYDRNKEYSRLGLRKEEKHMIFFGKTVYSYDVPEKSLHAFTLKPKQKGCRCYTFGAVTHARSHGYII